MAVFDVQKALNDGVPQERINQLLQSHPDLRPINAASQQNGVGNLLHGLIDDPKNPFNLKGYLQNTGDNAKRIVQNAANLGNQALQTSSLGFLTNPQQALDTTKQEMDTGAGIVNGAVGAITGAGKLAYDLSPMTSISNPQKSHAAAVNALNKTAEWSYKNPIDANAMLNPLLGKAIPGPFGGAGDAAEEAMPVADNAEQLATTGEKTLAPLEEEAAGRGTQIKKWMARNVVNPEVTRDNVGSLSKEEDIAQNAIDITQGKVQYSVAKDLEKSYEQVNNKLGSIVSQKSGQLGLIPVDTTPSGPGLMDEISASVENDPIIVRHPELKSEVENYIRKQLKTAKGQFGDAVTSTTTFNDLNDARKIINKSLFKWYQRGSPLVTEDDNFNHILEIYNQNLTSKLGEVSPEARQLITAQSNIIPAYKGIHAQLNPPKIPGSVFQIPTRIANTILDPIQIAISRNPNSEFAQSLRKLLETPDVPQ